MARSLFELRRSLAPRVPVDQWAASAGLSVAELESALREGRRSREKLVEMNIPLVASICKRYVFVLDHAEGYVRCLPVSHTSDSRDG